MFQSLFACPLGLVRPGATRSRDRLPPYLLAAGTALALVAAVATWPSAGPIPATSPATTLSVTVTAQSAAAPITDLRDSAEALRERLLALPGVGAVTVGGLQQQRLIVAYQSARLAALGVSAADLAASIPSDPQASTPGHLSVSLAAAQDGLQAVENRPVRAGGHIFRLGDIALVVRAPLEPPVSTLQVAGRPAVQLTVIPATGADRATLADAIAAVE